MDLIDLEDDTIDAEVMDSLAVAMDNFRVYGHAMSIWQFLLVGQSQNVGPGWYAPSIWQFLSLKTLTSGYV
jgi:hypothetical protein